jgi:hypothetical protein
MSLLIRKGRDFLYADELEGNPGFDGPEKQLQRGKLSFSWFAADEHCRVEMHPVERQGLKDLTRISPKS